MDPDRSAGPPSSAPPAAHCTDPAISSPSAQNPPTEPSLHLPQPARLNRSTTADSPRLKTEKKGKQKENTELQKKTEPEKQICKTKTKIKIDCVVRFLLLQVTVVVTTSREGKRKGS
jgi:hypothetical protein